MKKLKIIGIGAILFLTGCCCWYDENSLLKRESIEIEKNKLIEVGFNFMKNSENVYFCSQDYLVCDELRVKCYKILGVDSNTFEFLKDNSYAKDKNNVYRVWHEDHRTFSRLPTVRLIKNVDVETFEVLKHFYSKDKNHVYRGADLTDMDPETFEILNMFYVKDKDSVYDFHNKLENADPQTFEILKHGYAKDKNNVYHQGEKVLTPDAKTFRVLNEYYGRDDENCYNWTRYSAMSECDKIKN